MMINYEHFLQRIRGKVERLLISVLSGVITLGCWPPLMWSFTYGGSVFTGSDPATGTDNGRVITGLYEFIIPRAVTYRYLSQMATGARQCALTAHV